MPRANRDKIHEKVAAIQVGDFIEIKFLDACECKNVKRHQITNKVYATYKRVKGEVIGIKLDMVYGQPYLILMKPDGFGELIDIVSVPLSTVVNVYWLKYDRWLKKMNTVGVPYLGGGKWKQIRKEEGVGEETYEEEVE